MDQDSPYFHAAYKGCQIYDIWSSYHRVLKIYTKRRCKTHQVKLGRAGWEIGFYLGTPSINFKVEGQNYQGNLKHGRYSGVRIANYKSDKRTSN